MAWYDRDYKLEPPDPPPECPEEFYEKALQALANDPLRAAELIDQYANGVVADLAEELWQNAIVEEQEDAAEAAWLSRIEDDDRMPEYYDGTGRW